MTAPSDAVTNRTPAEKRSATARWKWVLAAIVVVVAWYGCGLTVWYLADRAANQGRLTVAELRLEWCRRFRFRDRGVDALQAQCARRQGDLRRWSQVIAAWSASSPSDVRLAVEKELMRVQSGVLQPDTQRQLNALLQAGGEANDVALAFASGYLARQDLEQAGKILSALDANGKRAGDVDYYWSIAAGIRGDLKESKDYLESVLKRCPGHELAHQALGQMLLEARRPNDALNHYLVVLRDAPTADSARIGAARCFRQMGKWNAASDLLTPVLESGNPEVIEEIAQIKLEQGDYQSAIARFDQVSAAIEKNHEGRMAASTAKALTGNHAPANELLDRDARLESLQKQLRELQIRVRLYPEDSEASRQFKAIKEQVLRERS